ncbi:hypothetical protein BD413DRAFT_227782 [Trametes elegans]|nr:hypothetical protein BD413DRAFT_227782 [Trametes elegans]
MGILWQEPWQSLNKLTLLHRLEIHDHANKSTFTSFATMPNIAQLKIGVLITASQPACHPFTHGPALRDLTLMKTAWDLALALNDMQISSLHGLDLSFDVMTATSNHLDHTVACFAACAAALSSSIVRDARIRNCFVDFLGEYPLWQRPVSLIQVLRPLFSLRAPDRLTAASYSCSSGFVATDDDLLAIGYAWEGIKGVRLRLPWAADRTGGREPVPTAEGLQ